MTSTGWIPLAAAFLTAVVGVWAIRHQRLGRLGRVRLVKEQLELVDVLGERFPEVSQRIRTSVEGELNSLYPPASRRLGRAVLIAQTIGGCVAAIGLFASAHRDHSQLTVLDGLALGAAIGVVAMICGEAYRSVQMVRAKVRKAGGWSEFLRVASSAKSRR